MVAAVEDGGLAGVAREVDLLAAGLDDVTVLSGGAASIEGLERSITSQTTCVHLAAHGLYRPFAPGRSGIRLADGWLTSARAAAPQMPADDVAGLLYSHARQGKPFDFTGHGGLDAGAALVIALEKAADFGGRRPAA